MILKVEKMYYRFIEENMTGEGEVWNAFIKEPETEQETEAFDAFMRIIRLSSNKDSEDSYYFMLNSDGRKMMYFESDVALLMSENEVLNQSYMEPYRVGVISPNAIKINKSISDEAMWYDVQEHLYKMKLINKREDSDE